MIYRFNNVILFSFRRTLTFSELKSSCLLGKLKESNASTGLSLYEYGSFATLNEQK